MKTISLYGQRLESCAQYAQSEISETQDRAERPTGREYGCLTTVLMVVGISAGFVTAIFSMLSAL